MDAPKITTDNLIFILSDPQQRSNLQKAMDREQGGHLPLSNLYADLARKCAATPEQLHTVVKALLAFKHRYRKLLCPLAFHPNMAERTLLLLCEKRCCITQLGHRSGPQGLLERIVEKYHCSEAITTLALQYYSKPEYPTELFAEFLQEYSSDYMLRYNITRSTELPPDKWEAVQRIFSSIEDGSKV